MYTSREGQSDRIKLLHAVPVRGVELHVGHDCVLQVEEKEVSLGVGAGVESEISWGVGEGVGAVVTILRQVVLLYDARKNSSQLLPAALLSPLFSFWQV
jgi:hypothetical protein